MVHFMYIYISDISYIFIYMHLQANPPRRRKL